MPGLPAGVGPWSHGFLWTWRSLVCSSKVFLSHREFVAIDAVERFILLGKRGIDNKTQRAPAWGTSRHDRDPTTSRYYRDATYSGHTSANKPGRHGVDSGESAGRCRRHGHITSETHPSGLSVTVFDIIQYFRAYSRARHLPELRPRVPTAPRRTPPRRCSPPHCRPIGRSRQPSSRWPHR